MIYKIFLIYYWISTRGCKNVFFSDMISTVNTDGHVVFIYLVRPDYYIIKLNSSNIINEQKQYNKLNKNKLRKRLKWNWRRRSRFERSVCSNQQLI